MDVKIKGKLPKGQLVYITPKQGYCYRNQLLVNEGVTDVGNEGRIVSKVTTFHKYERSIPAGTLIGHLFLAESANMLQERREKELRLFCLVYLDDALIYSDNEEEHFKIFRSVIANVLQSQTQI